MDIGKDFFPERAPGRGSGGAPSPGGISEGWGGGTEGRGCWAAMALSLLLTPSDAQRQGRVQEEPHAAKHRCSPMALFCFEA